MLTRIRATVLVGIISVVWLTCAGCSRGTYLAPTPRDGVYYDDGVYDGNGPYNGNGFYNRNGFYNGNGGYYTNGGRDLREGHGQPARNEVGHVEQGAAPTVHEGGHVEQGKHVTLEAGTEEHKDHK